jgi:hypothetical protein
VPSITSAHLSVNTDLPQDLATVAVTCDVQFTDVEVNAMDVLGLQYQLSCRLLNKYLLEENSVLTFDDQTLPSLGGGRHLEHAEFEATVAAYDLNERLFGKDKFVAEIRLRNTETDEEVVARTDEISVDVAA